MAKHGPPPRPPRELLGRWLVARVATVKPYPCMCATGCWRGKSLICRCRGRTDVDKAPARCCGRRAATAEVRAERAT